ncbi:MAG: Ig-like domain-containing protein [Muribaculaceae bacterium]|nr:Ig-like domain-containing protein [Muribaculaceae bacterium]
MSSRFFMRIGKNAFDGCPADNIAVTAMTPPSAFNDIFSNYNGKLILQGNLTAYLLSYSCWNKFNNLNNIYSTINPTELKVEGDKAIIGSAGDTFELSAKLYPENLTLPYVFWRSTNPETATVDYNGKVTLRAGMADCDDTSTYPCKIIAESLYANGPVAEFTVIDTTGSVLDVIDTTESSYAIDFTLPVEVYNLRGEMVTLLCHRSA